MRILICNHAFVRKDILISLRELIDQFVSEGVLVPDSSCSHASPLVIVPKKEGGIRIAVDYREVNQFLKVSANQLPYQNMLFQQLSGQKFNAKIDNLWGYHQLKLSDESSKVTAIITPFGITPSIWSLSVFGVPIWHLYSSW